MKVGPNCVCGSIRFVSSYPRPNEEQIAVKLYEKEIEEANLYTKIAQEVVKGWENNDYR